MKRRFRFSDQITLAITVTIIIFLLMS